MEQKKCGVIIASFPCMIRQDRHQTMNECMCVGEMGCSTIETMCSLYSFSHNSQIFFVAFHFQMTYFFGIVTSVIFITLVVLGVVGNFRSWADVLHNKLIRCNFICIQRKRNMAFIQKAEKAPFHFNFSSRVSFHALYALESSINYSRNFRKVIQ